VKQPLRYIIFALLLINSTLFFAQTKGVVATTSIIADITSKIGGDKVSVKSLVPVGSDPHLFDPVPSDAEMIAQADLIFRNGLTLEGWLDKLLFNSGTKAEIVTVTTGVEAIAHETYENAYDPHAWMSCKNAIIYAENISWALAELMPEHKAFFENNCKIYTKELEALNEWVIKQLRSISEKHKVLVTSHDAFRYFANDYGLRVISVLGTSTDADININDLNSLIQDVKKLGLPAIFVESTINPKLLKQVAHDQGIRIGGKLFADSLGDEESGAETYIKMIRHNTRTIVSGLTGAGDRTSFKNHEWILMIILFFTFGATIFLVSYLLKGKKHSLEYNVGQHQGLEIENLTTSYQRNTVLSNVNLFISTGKLYGIIGPNGSGKSTLIKSILGLIETDLGKVSYKGSALDDVKDKLAYIPQKEEIDWDFPASVSDVVLMGVYPGKKVLSRITNLEIKKMEDALEELGIIELKDRQIGELSGGQQQRVFLARAICQDAMVYLLDEPFVGVDVVTEERIIKLLKKLAKENKIIVMIHHDLSKVEEYFDDIIMINRRIVAAGPVSEVFNESNIQRAYSGQLPILQKTDNLIG
jgi:ABC-type Zn uptake system ZnuABC Zn-binding protein ZnuA/ABC-type Mn2+/Zn2+ transport system ATPase subunit